jgi:DNA repair protein RadD
MSAPLIPRDYQTEAVNSIWHYFQTHATGNPVVALPTGTGKAFCIALFLQQVLMQYPNQRILIVTHSKELIGQNYEEFLGLWPTAPAGIFSAGLKRKDLFNRITFCGIASINKHIEKFGHVDLMLVDECDLISDKETTMYRKVIAKLTEVNKYLKLVGFTATPWRTGQGMITDEGGIFTDICFNATDMASFNWFIEEGYLIPLVSPITSTFINLEGVHVRGGEFVEKELQKASSNDEVTFAAVQETVAGGLARNREHWLVFATGVANTVKVTEMLQYLGIPARCVHSNMSDGERDQNIKDWKDGKFTAMVNNGILTTGVNYKKIDFIIMLRGTASSRLWVQMLGRGTRPDYAPGYDLTTKAGRLAAIAASQKHDCLVFDFARNVERLGPINDPVIPKQKGKGTGELPIKTCDTEKLLQPDDKNAPKLKGCGMYNHPSARFCGGHPFKTEFGCGAEFSFKSKIVAEASTGELIRTVKEDDAPVFKEFVVKHITYDIHRKIGKPECLRVTYWCGNQKFNDFVFFEHEGGAQRKARKWWAERTSAEFPSSTAKAHEQIHMLLEPKAVKVWMNCHPYPKVHQVSFTGAFQKPIVGDEVPF